MCFPQPDVKVTLTNPVTVKSKVSSQSAKDSESIHQDKLNNICIIIKLSDSQGYKDPTTHYHFKESKIPDSRMNNNR